MHGLPALLAQQRALSACRRVGAVPKGGGGPEGWGPRRVGAQNFALFFPLPPQFSFFFSLFGGLRRGGGTQGWGTEGWGPEEGGRGRVGPRRVVPRREGGRGEPKISRFFFPLPPQFSFFFSLLFVLSLNVGGVFEGW